MEKLSYQSMETCIECDQPIKALEMCAKHYHAIYQPIRYRRRMDEMKGYLGGKCSEPLCEATGDLEFDHVDPSTKSYTIASKWNRPWDFIVQELDKCQLLCRKHHVEKTNRNGEHKGGHNRIVNPAHGTAVRYRGGCRCAKCRSWKREYRLKVVDARGNPINNESQLPK